MLREPRTARAGCHRRTTSRGVVSRQQAFTLLELLASIAIIALVISIMLPSMSVMKEKARRIKCGTTVHQQGAALAMWADTRGRDELPTSRAGHGSQQGSWSTPVFANLHLAETMCLYSTTSQSTGSWDGMGKLYEYDYLEAPAAFYCPSHDGQHPYERYQEIWPNPGGQRIYGNYHYRGVPWEFRLRKFSQLGPDVTLLTDGMRTLSDFSHVDGCNMLKADLSVRWFDDSNGAILSKLSLLEESLSDGERSRMYLDIWQLLDSNGGKTSSNTGDYDGDFLGSFPGAP